MSGCGIAQCRRRNANGQNGAAPVETVRSATLLWHVTLQHRFLWGDIAVMEEPCTARVDDL